MNKNNVLTAILIGTVATLTQSATSHDVILHLAQPTEHLAQRNALIFAARRGNIEQLKKLLNQNNSNFYHQPTQNSLLHLAALSGFNVKNISGRMENVYDDREEAIKTLLDHRADLTHKNIEGKTPYSYLYDKYNHLINELSDQSKQNIEKILNLIAVEDEQEILK